MSHDDTGTLPLDDRLTPEELPRIAIFVAGFLRDDGGAGPVSAARAAFDYAADAELDELEELASEWETLLAAARELPLERVNACLRERFGSAWQASSVHDFEAVAAELERALRE
jgi:hypothetical protein